MSDTPTPELPTVRLTELCEALRVALGGGRGWQSAAAELLGVTPAYVSRLMSPTDHIRVGGDVVSRIRKAHGIPEGFFFDQEHGQGAEVYAELLVPQAGLALGGETRADDRGAALHALNRVIDLAERARTAVLSGEDAGAFDRLTVAIGPMMLELGAYRERIPK